MRFVHLVIAPAILAACIVADLVEGGRADAAIEKAAAGAKATAKGAAIEPHLLAEFKATDADGNGVLSRAEVDARVARMAAGSKRFTPVQAKRLTERYFTLADADRDGGISAAEWQGMMRAMANRYDANHDGVVSVAEREAARKAAIAEAKAAGDTGR